MSIIANPIYENVFTHLMEDFEIARGMATLVLGEKVVEIEPRQQEMAVVVHPPPAPVLRYRVNFAALVETADGSRRKILLQLQKSGPSDETARFRSCGGPDDAQKTLDGEVRPIVPICLLGFCLDERPAKLIKSVHALMDGATGEALRLTWAEPSIDCPDRGGDQREKKEEPGDTELGRLLSLFDQRKMWGKNRYFLDVSGDAWDGLTGLIVRKLAKVATDEETLARLPVEDEVRDAFAKKDRELREAQARTKKVREEREQAEREAKKAREEREQAEREAKEAREEREQAEREAREAREEREQAEREAKEAEARASEALLQMEAMRAKLRAVGLE